MAIRVASVALLLGLAGCTPSAAPDQACSGPYPAPTPCDASTQCSPASCSCGDGTMSGFARGGLCTDAGACDPQALCSSYCLTAGGLTSICR